MPTNQTNILKMNASQLNKIEQQWKKQNDRNGNHASTNNTTNKKIISKKIDSALLQLKVITLLGDVYRIIFGKKELTTSVSLKPIPPKDNTILMTEEHMAGDTETQYTVNNITVSDVTENDDTQTDFSFEELGNYSMQGYIFDYQVIPTLDKGPKVIKTFVNPTKLFTVKGYLSDSIIKAENPPPKNLPDKTNFIPFAAGITQNITKQLDKTITL